MSLSRRALLSVLIVMSIFLSITAYILDNQFKKSTEKSIQGRLENVIYILIAATQQSKLGDPVLQKTVAIPQLDQSSSGLYAQLTDNNNGLYWHSPSLGGNVFLSESLPDIAKFKFDRRVDHALGELFVVRLGISFDPTRKGKIFTYHVAESASIFYEEIYGFRKNLITWFVFLALIMMGTVAVTLSGALSPVRRAAQEIKAVEQGKQNRMLEHYPNEISVLTENLNQLIASNQNQLERQSNALSDLAHSLKTPLATAIATVENETMDLIHKQNVLEQMDTINSVIEYQLKRAQTKGKVHLSQPIAVFSIVEKVVKSLKKVHSDKNLRVCTEIDHDLSVKCDKGDLYELFGNLLDNAFKWARSTVGIKAVLQESKLTITVQDDGPGIDGVLAENAFERGVKSDTVRGGSGIGLAVVADIVSAYSGHIETKNLNPCGLEITLSLFQ